MRNRLSAIAVIIFVVGFAVSCGQEGGGNAVPGLTTPTLDDGAAAFERGDFATALTIFRALAEQDNVRAQFNLGVMHYLGQGTAQDYNEAARWYRMAADLGGVRAQFNLGLMYENGEGVAQNREEALRLYHMAADQSHPGAQAKITEFAALTPESDSVSDASVTDTVDDAAPLDVAQAPAPAPPPAAIEDEVVQVVAAPDEVPAPEALALSALTMSPAPDAAPPVAAPVEAAPPVAAPVEAEPVATMAEAQAAYERADFATAVSQFQELAVQGDASAQYTLGVMYANGQGVGQDEAQAVRYFRRQPIRGMQQRNTTLVPCMPTGKAWVRMI